VELGPVIPGDGLERQAAALDRFHGCAVDRFDGPVRQLGDHRQPCAALDQCQQAVALANGANHCVAFPVADLNSILDLHRPSVDHGLALELSTAFGARRALASPAVGPLLGLAGPVGTVSPMAAVTPDLAADRAGRTLQDAGNRS